MDLAICNLQRANPSTEGEEMMMCSVCGQQMWKGNELQIWYCSYCPHVHDPEAMAINKMAILQARVEELEAQLAHVQKGEADSTC